MRFSYILINAQSLYFVYNPQNGFIYAHARESMKVGVSRDISLQNSLATRFIFFMPCACS